MTERDAPRLRKTLLGTIRSEEGWSVRIAGPLAVVYTDGLGDVRVSAEARGGRRTGFELYTDSLAPLPRERADLVVRRIGDAFAYAGWHLRVT